MTSKIQVGDDFVSMWISALRRSSGLGHDSRACAESTRVAGSFPP